MKNTDNITTYYVRLDEIDGKTLEAPELYLYGNPPEIIIVHGEMFSFEGDDSGVSFSIAGVMGEFQLKMVGDKIKVVNQTLEPFRINPKE